MNKMFKTFFVSVFLLCLTFMSWESASAYSNSDSNEHAGWDDVEKIVKSIDKPSIPNREYDITDFGAAKDGSDARPAIMKAIKKANEEGGGRVTIPSGNWFSKGPIHLKSNIDLHISVNATLKFSGDPADYLPVVKTRWEGTELYGYSPMIYASNVHDVAITGKGVIDGNSESEFHSWNKLQKNDQETLREMGNNLVPVEDRVFGEGTYLRPSIIQFFGAERVLLEDYTVKNSPFWINHLVYTDHATVRNLYVDSHFANNDGVDVDSSRYVLVEDNTFRTGDDSVVVKSGRDADGRNIGKPSEYVIVRNNDMGGEDGIALGSEMSGDIRYVIFTDNLLRSGDAAFRFKGSEDRGGIAEHIIVRNAKVESFDRLFWFQLNYPGDLGGGYPSIYRDVVFENITVESADTAFEVHAPESQPLQDVHFKDITVKKTKTPFILENVDNLKFDNVSINGMNIVDSANGMVTLVQRYLEEKALNPEIAHQLKMQLTAINYYEKKEMAEKVVKHTKGFKSLLEHQKQGKLISENVYKNLIANADFLIEKWQ